METVCVYIGDAIGRYGFGDHHPFGTHRMGVFWDAAHRRGLADRVCQRDPVMATPVELARFHTPDYVAQVRQQSATGEGFLDHGDTPAFHGVYEAAAHVAGSVLAAADQIMNGQCRRAFVPIAGLHHARRDRAGGFCVFNDCGIVIEALRAKHGLQRIAYVDIDAHHGDGVYYGFESDPELIFADIHEDGRFLYPGTGDRSECGLGAAQGRKLNIPLPPGANDAHFHPAWFEVEAFLRQWEPEFVILQCGADSIAGDPITHMQFSSNAHQHAATRLAHLTETWGHGRVLAVGGGGYNSANIAAGWCAVLQGLVEYPVSTGVSSP